MNHDVFISYSSQDVDTAFAVCEFLESHHIGCWIAPRNITPGNSWSREIIKGLKESILTIVVYSDASNASDHVANELAISHDNLHPIIPLHITRQIPAPDIEKYIISDESIYAVDDEVGKHLDSLLETVRRYVDMSANRNAIDISTDFDAVICIDGRPECKCNAGSHIKISLPEGEYRLSAATIDNEFEYEISGTPIPSRISLGLRDVMRHCGLREIATMMEYSRISNFFGAYGYFRQGIMSVNIPSGGIGDDTIFIDRNGLRVFNLSETGFMSSDSCSEGLIPVYKHNSEKYGYIDLNGNLAIDRRFDYAYDFCDGLATVKIGDHFGVIDRNGEYVVMPTFDEHIKFKNGLMPCINSDNGKAGYVDTSFNFVIPPVYDQAYDFCHGTAIVNIGGKESYINPAGDKIDILGEHDECFHFSRYGLAKVRDADGDRIIDRRGNIVAHYDKIRRLSKFYDFYVITHNGLDGLLFPWGEICLNPEYEFTDERFRNGSVPLIHNGRSGFADALGKVRMYPDGIAKIDTFYYNIAACKSHDGKKGFVDAELNIVCEPVFDDISISEDMELMAAKHAQLFGYVTRDGILDIPCVFDEAHYGFGSNRFTSLVRIGAHRVRIGLNGMISEIVELKYDDSVDLNFDPEFIIPRFIHDVNSIIGHFTPTKDYKTAFAISKAMRQDMDYRGLLKPLKPVPYR